jgi:hypothetical protein
MKNVVVIFDGGITSTLGLIEALRSRPVEVFIPESEKYESHGTILTDILDTIVANPFLHNPSAVKVSLVPTYYGQYDHYVTPNRQITAYIDYLAEQVNSSEITASVETLALFNLYNADVTVNTALSSALFDTLKSRQLAITTFADSDRCHIENVKALSCGLTQHEDAVTSLDKLKQYDVKIAELSSIIEFSRGNAEVFKLDQVKAKPKTKPRR